MGGEERRLAREDTRFCEKSSAYCHENAVSKPMLGKLAGTLKASFGAAVGSSTTAVEVAEAAEASGAEICGADAAFALDASITAKDREEYLRVDILND
jgi:uncharacterized membrane protein YadS